MSNQPNQNRLIADAILEYYRLEINGKMPNIITPSEDPDLVCCVMDRVKYGRFNQNVVYGKGLYFTSSVDSVIATLRYMPHFKEIKNKDDILRFKFIGSK